MKTNFMNKAFALLTSIITASAMTASMSAFAVNSPTIDEPPAMKLQTSKETAQIPIPKDIVLFNSQESMIYLPNIVYTYEITSADVTNATISTKTKIDDNTYEDTVLTVHPGVMGAITAISDEGDSESQMQTNGSTKTGTLTFGKWNVLKKMTNPITTTGNVKVGEDYKGTKAMTITINASNIYDQNGDGIADGHAGVYRYKITDVTTPETYAQSGVTDGGATDELFLDVYVKNNLENNGLLVYGYVLLKSYENEGANTSITYNEEATEQVKVHGFVTQSEGDTNSDGTVVAGDLTSDRYETYNLTVKNQVAGDLADRNHRFPFEIQLTNSGVTSRADFYITSDTTSYRYNLDGNGGWNSTAWNEALPNMTNPEDTDTGLFDFKLKHDETLKFIGLPANTFVNAKEKNDTQDIYTVSALFNNLAQSLKMDTTTNTTIAVPKNTNVQLETDNAIINQTKDDELIITNTLRDVSVTGLLFDIAPFLFITGAGIFLFSLYLRNKKDTDMDNII